VRQIVSSLAVVLPSRKKALIALETLAIGTAGGLLFLWANLPGGLISGAMVLTGIAAICGRQLAVPPLITQGVLVVLGISLGSVVSRQLIAHVGAHHISRFIFVTIAIPGIIHLFGRTQDDVDD
jgi:uncharacterized membrane protein AbrB (regulator of aidB expression)